MFFQSMSDPKLLRYTPENFLCSFQELIDLIRRSNHLNSTASQVHPKQNIINQCQDIRTKLGSGPQQLSHPNLTLTPKENDVKNCSGPECTWLALNLLGLESITVLVVFVFVCLFVCLFVCCSMPLTTASLSSSTSFWHKHMAWWEPLSSHVMACHGLYWCLYHWPWFTITFRTTTAGHRG